MRRGTRRRSRRPRHRRASRHDPAHAAPRRAASAPSRLAAPAQGSRRRGCAGRSGIGLTQCRSKWSGRVVSLDVEDVAEAVGGRAARPGRPCARLARSSRPSSRGRSTRSRSSPARPRERIEDRARRVGRRRECLRHPQLAALLVICHEIRESPSGVDACTKCHLAPLLPVLDTSQACARSSSPAGTNRERNTGIRPGLRPFASAASLRRTPACTTCAPR